MENTDRMTILTYITENKLIKLAGAQSYVRGEEYFEEDRIKGLLIEDDNISARVHGTHIYRVKIWMRKTTMEYSCTCPLFERDEVFCKHLVAVSLAAREASSGDSISGNKRKKKKGNVLTSDDIERFLSAQEKQTVIALLMDYARSDDRLYEKLLMKTASAGENSGIASFKHAIDESICAGEFIDYRSMYEYSERMYDIIHSLRDYLQSGNAEAVIELTEHFLKRLEVQLNMVDDSDGYMGDILYEVQDLHYRACNKVKPDPKHLAKKLFEWELNSDWEIFYGAAEKYASILGKDGMNVYSELAEKEWNRIKPLGPGKDRESYSGNRSRITRIMETLAAKTGDVERLVTIKAKDLSHPYHYLEIAEIYKKAGKKEKTLEWAERGVKSFPNNRDSRLYEFLANEYQKRRRFDEAMKMIWHIFTDYPTLNDYKLLRKYAVRCGGAKLWQTWREKALEHIRKSIAQDKEEAKNRRWVWNTVDNSTLVDIFLWEKDSEQAWLEAKEGGCSESLWFTLARMREKDHPEDTLAVYRSFVEPTIMQKNNQAYREAVEMIKKIKQLMTQLYKKAEWEKFIESIKTNHKPKRNLMKMLEKIK
jgi:uncharacterized Zn finger protein